MTVFVVLCRHWIYLTHDAKPLCFGFQYWVWHKIVGGVTHSSAVKSALDHSFLPQPPTTASRRIKDVVATGVLVDYMIWNDWHFIASKTSLHLTNEHSMKNTAQSKKKLCWWLCSWKTHLHIKVKRYLLFEVFLITRPSCTQGLQLELFQFCQQQSISQREGWICRCVAQMDHISGNCREKALL